MRLIAERLLLTDAAGATFVDRELISQTLKPLPPPNGAFHVYCSPVNLGVIVAQCGPENSLQARREV